MSFTNILKCPLVFERSCCGWVSEFRGMVHVQAPVAPGVLRPGAAGSEVSSALLGIWYRPRVGGAQRRGNACRSTSCLTVVLNPLLAGMISALKAGICAFSAVLGKTKGHFFLTDCKPQPREWSENYTKLCLLIGAVRYLLFPPTPHTPPQLTCFKSFFFWPPACCLRKVRFFQASENQKLWVYQAPQYRLKHTVNRRRSAVTDYSCSYHMWIWEPSQPGQRWELEKL